ncbi:MAG: DUF255 domain-containing protein, partial [Bacteroidales bacterium]|nr:DUF255 domain-containing protein [Bacteroidales bacterium]
MTKKITIALLAVLLAAAAYGQTGMKKVYDEEINVNQQIDKALSQAKAAGKFVVCQVGGNWCPWCLRFADFITKDADISKLIADNFV